MSDGKDGPSDKEIYRGTDEKLKKIQRRVYSGIGPQEGTIVMYL